MGITYIVHGGKRLSGSVAVGSGKNAPVALLAASLLVRGHVRLFQMSRVEEVERMLEILSSINVRHRWEGETTLLLDTRHPLTITSIHRSLCAEVRAVLLFLGALATREKHYRLYKSGGCRLGERTIRPHLYALEQLGVKVVSKTRYYEVTNAPLRSANVVMYESGDTATENAIMAAVLAPGVTTIRFASANYMVQDLCHFLVATGAKIEGIGTTTLRITGVKKLRPTVSYAIAPDPVDAMAWISLAITTKSRLRIKNCSLDFLALELEYLRRMGQKYRLFNERRSESGHFPLADVEIIPSPLHSLPDKLHPRPYPGFNIDNIPLFLPILTQAKGQTLVHDWVYENRVVYYLELQKLGAKMILLDPHRVLVNGPTTLIGNEVVCPPALRPGMALLISMIAARGRSVLRNAYQVERGYEDLLLRLNQIGANVERIVS